LNEVFALYHAKRQFINKGEVVFLVNTRFFVNLRAMKKIFVTGGDGLLGSNVVRKLLEQGHEVTVMVQPGSTARTLEALNIKTVEADLLDKEKVIQASEGADIIIHIAALTSVWPSRGEIYYKVNVTGTEHIIEAALTHQVERLVHVGSASSFGFGTLENPGKESDPCKSAKYGLDYIDSKLKGQEVVIEAVKTKGLPAIVVNPTFMIGPHDSRPSSGAMILAAANREIPGASPGGKNWAYVGDVAQGVCNAMTMGRIGECYILGGVNLSYADALREICEAIGSKPPPVTFPPFLVKLAGWSGQTISKLIGKPPKLTYPMAWVSCEGHYFSPQKAIDELALPQTPLKTAAKEAMDWFKANGYI
jgi:dihydroflavonol-4-reductase